MLTTRPWCLLSAANGQLQVRPFDAAALSSPRHKWRLQLHTIDALINGSDRVG